MAAVKVKINGVWYILPNMKGDKGAPGAAGESAIVPLTALPASGTPLAAGAVYYGTFSGAWVFSPPAGNTLDLDYENIIRIYFAVTGAAFIDWGTANYVNGVEPVIEEDVSYTAEYIYNRVSSAWELTVVGKGGVPT